MSIKTFGKQSSQLFINNNLVDNNCKEIYGNGSELLIKNCDYSPDQNFINIIFAQLPSRRKMSDRLQSDFGLINDIDDIDNFDDSTIVDYINLEPFYIDFKNYKKRKTKKKRKIKNKTNKTNKTIKKYKTNKTNKTNKTIKKYKTNKK